MEIDRSKISPMMKQYLDTKDDYPDTILFSVWATFMKCFLMMHFWYLKLLNLP